MSGAVFRDTLTHLGLLCAPLGAGPLHHPSRTRVLPPTLAPTGPKPCPLSGAPTARTSISTSKRGGKSQPSSTHGLDTFWGGSFPGKWCSGLSPCPILSSMRAMLTPAPLPTPSPTSQQPQAPIISSPTPSPQKELRGGGGGVGVPRGGGTSQTKRTRPEQRALNYTWGEGSAISGALVSGVAGGVGVPHPAGQGREQGTRGELQSPISRGWGPHRGTPRSGGSIIPVSLAQRVPHGECPRPSALPGWVFPKYFRVENLIPPVGAAGRGMGRGSTGKSNFGGKIPFPPVWGWP